jgi:membrane associated rhomboid family serine protease
LLVGLLLALSAVGIDLTALLVLVGGCLYVLKQPMSSMALFAGVAGLVGGIMPLYCYYLGHRREVENRQPGGVPSALLRCPFVMGILGKSREAIVGSALDESAAVFEKNGQRVSS